MFNKLRGRIVEKFGSVKRFCEETGICRVTLNNKLSGRTVFTADDITKICDALDIDVAEIGDYFFAEKVAKK